MIPPVRSFDETIPSIEAKSRAQLLKGVTDALSGGSVVSGGGSGYSFADHATVRYLRDGKAVSLIAGSDHVLRSLSLSVHVLQTYEYFELLSFSCFSLMLKACFSFPLDPFQYLSNPYPIALAFFLLSDEIIIVIRCCRGGGGGVMRYRHHISHSRSGQQFSSNNRRSGRRIRQFRRYCTDV